METEVERMVVWLIKRDKDILRWMADEEGESVSVVVRRIIRKVVQEYINKKEGFPNGK